MISLLNTGKLNLFLWGFDIPSDEPGANKQRFAEPRLIAANAEGNQSYWIEVPAVVLKEKPGHTFRFRLYLTDDLGQKWISDHGGQVLNKFQVEVSGKKTEATAISVWSYAMRAESWNFSEAEYRARPTDTGTLGSSEKR